MSRSSNSLKVSDVITTPIKLKYSASYDLTSFTANDIRVLKGYNSPVTITGSVPQTTLNYLSIRHLYYSNYLTGSFPISASSADNFLQSTAASGTINADIRYFPTQSGAEITIISIPTSVYGQQVSRQSFMISSSQYLIGDDGNGNIREINPQYTSSLVSNYFDPNIYYASGALLYGAYVGNIIYSQGMAIITNPDYQVFFPACKSYRIQYVAGAGDVVYEYTDCSGNVVDPSPLAGGYQTFCAQSGSVTVYSGNYTLTDNGLCS